MAINHGGLEGVDVANIQYNWTGVGEGGAINNLPGLAAEYYLCPGNPNRPTDHPTGTWRICLTTYRSLLLFFFFAIISHLSLPLLRVGFRKHKYEEDTAEWAFYEPGVIQRIPDLTPMGSPWRNL